MNLYDILPVPLKRFIIQRQLNANQNLLEKVISQKVVTPTQLEFNTQTGDASQHMLRFRELMKLPDPQHTEARRYIRSLPVATIAALNQLWVNEVESSTDLVAVRKNR